MCPEQDGHETRKLRTRQQVIEAAIQQFSEQGFEHTSIADIAKAAGIGRRTFYLHFADKEAVLDAIMSQKVLEIRHALQKFPHQGFKVALRSALREILKWINENLSLAQIMMGSDGTVQGVERMQRHVTQAFYEEMSAMAKPNPDSPLDFTFIAQAIAGMLFQVTHTYKANQTPIDVELTTERMMTMLYDSLDNHYTEE